MGSKSETDAAFQQIVEAEISTLAELLTMGGTRSVVIMVIATDGEDIDHFGMKRTKQVHKAILQEGLPFAMERMRNRLA